MEFDKKNKTVILKDLKKEEYVKGNIFLRAKYRVTKDFIICSAYTTPLRHYLVNDNIQISSLMVWAKRNGNYKGNGFSYRIENIGYTDTMFSLIVNDHNQNIISYISNQKYIIKVKLENKIKLVRNNTKDGSIDSNSNQQLHEVKSYEDLEDFDI